MNNLLPPISESILSDNAPPCKSITSIVINSHISSDIARNHLIKSMMECDDFKSYKIIIVIGGYYDIPTYETTIVDNITYIKANHNSIDYTGLITLLDIYSENEDNYYFYMHDTCRVGPLFFKNLSNIQLDNVLSIRLGIVYSMNIGVYSQRIINQHAEFLKKRICKNQENLIHFKQEAIDLEDAIFNNDNTNYIINNNTTRETSGPSDYYNTGTMRIVEYYSNMDLYKIKANWRKGDNILRN